jgi:hypothetical protein
MKAITQDNASLNYDQITRLACRLWESEGCQSGWDQHYWLAAENPPPAEAGPDKEGDLKALRPSARRPDSAPSAAYGISIHCDPTAETSLNPI